MKGDERERMDRTWHWTLRVVLGLALLSAVGFGVWVMQPPRLDFEVVFEARDGTIQPVRVAGAPRGTSPVTLSLDELRALATPASLEAYRARSAEKGVVVRTFGMDLGRDARLEVQVLEAGTPETWLHVTVRGTTDDAELALPVSLGPEAAPWVFDNQGHMGSSALVTHDVRYWVLFSAP